MTTIKLHKTLFVWSVHPQCSRGVFKVHPTSASGWRLVSGFLGSAVALGDEDPLYFFNKEFLGLLKT